ncbi:MAG: helix-turn-helix transcriptional regulator [Candidatus Aenigmarchaeota archaeon]|nr:helix-turn-helix transcriptional regulator [Candidatus Aenigmarchaeota archaeon]
MKDGQMKIIHLISKKYTYGMLKCLETGAKRFKDLKEACEGEKMRTQRLRELEDFGLIDIDVKRVGRRPVSFYRLSEKGKTILKLVDEMKKSMKGV